MHTFTYYIITKDFPLVNRFTKFSHLSENFSFYKVIQFSRLFESFSFYKVSSFAKGFTSPLFALHFWVGEGIYNTAFALHFWFYRLLFWIFSVFLHHFFRFFYLSAPLLAIHHTHLNIWTIVQMFKWKLMPMDEQWTYNG